MKNLKKFIEFINESYQESIDLEVPWTQSLQRAFDMCQDTYDIWDVELDRTDDDNVKLIGGTEEERERVKSYLFNSGIL